MHLELHDVAQRVWVIGVDGERSFVPVARRFGIGVLVRPAQSGSRVGVASCGSLRQEATATVQVAGAVSTYQGDAEGVGGEARRASGSSSATASSNHPS